MSRKIHIVGNWKMNQNLSEINSFFQSIDEKIADYNNCEAWLAPQSIHLGKLLRLSENKSKIKVGSQNCSHQSSGAFTGDISPSSLKDLGIHFTLVGHSERRAFFKENDEILNTKAKLALDNNLKVIFCVGETLEERESGNTENVVKKQIELGLKGINKDLHSNIIVAYEPVWAIGTGKTASPEQAQEVHNYIRKILSTEVGFDSEKTEILYGGSVKPSNVKELLSQNDIDGALVGGASLKPQDFLALVEAGNVA